MNAKKMTIEDTGQLKAIYEFGGYKIIYMPEDADIDRDDFEALLVDFNDKSWDSVNLGRLLKFVRYMPIEDSKLAQDYYIGRLYSHLPDEVVFDFMNNYEYFVKEG